MITRKRFNPPLTSRLIDLLLLFGYGFALVESLFASSSIQVGERSIELTGIAKDHRGVTAYLIVRRSKWDSQISLTPGQQKDGIELRQVSFDPPEVKLSVDTKDATLGIDPTQKSKSPTASDVRYEISRMPLSQVIDLYGSLSGRTVIQEMTFPNVAITAAADASRGKAVEMLRASLKARNIVLTDHRQKFALLVSDASEVRKLPDFPPILEGRTADEVIPASMIFLRGMPLSQFVQLYELYSGRKVLVPPRTPDIAINLKQETDLTRAEVVHAFDAFFALNGFQLRPQGNGRWELSR